MPDRRQEHLRTDLQSLEIWCGAETAAFGRLRRQLRSAAITVDGGLQPWSPARRALLAARSVSAPARCAAQVTARTSDRFDEARKSLEQAQTIDQEKRLLNELQRGAAAATPGAGADRASARVPRQRLRVHATVGLAGLQVFVALRELSLAECRLPQGSLQQLAQSRLSSLEIRRCGVLAKIAPEDLLAAARLPSLRRLALRDLGAGVAWSDVLAALRGNRALREVDLRGNELPPGCADRLREALPDADLRVRDASQAVERGLRWLQGR